MLRVAGVVLGAVAVIVAILAAAFFSWGGMQIVRVLRGPALPSAAVAASPAGDLAYLKAVVLATERGPTAEQFARFAEIIDSAPAPTDVDDLTLIASRALAQLDNAHSTLARPMMRRLPIRLHWTSDALIIVKAQPDYAHLLGQRVLTMGGRRPEDLLPSMPQLVGGGTPGWVRYRSEYFFSAPAALRFLGADVASDQVELRLTNAAGAESVVVLPASAEPAPDDPFWDGSAYPGDASLGTEGWVTLLRANDPELPLYLQETERLYLLRALPEHDAVYIRMNGSINDETETAAQFGDRVLGEVARSQARNFIVDFRNNSSGDFTLPLGLIERLADALPEDGRVYLIVGPRTFSAGLLSASQLKRFVPDRLTVVGSQVGDRLRFRGEGHMVTLPTTGVVVYVPTAWDDVAANCGWFDDCWPPNKILLRGVGDLTPDINVANTWESYRSGDDLVVNAVLADIEQRARS